MTHLKTAHCVIDGCNEEVDHHRSDVLCENHVDESLKMIQDENSEEFSVEIE